MNDMILIYAKISVILTVLYAGLNVHQLTCSYAYLLQKIEELKILDLSQEDQVSMSRLSAVFYLGLPLAYLILLWKAEFHFLLLVVLLLKFLMTALISWWTEKKIISQQGYTLQQHRLNQIDNGLNVLTAIGVGYFLLHPMNI